MWCRRLAVGCRRVRVSPCRRRVSHVVSSCRVQGVVLLSHVVSLPPGVAVALRWCRRGVVARRVVSPVCVAGWCRCTSCRVAVWCRRGSVASFHGRSGHPHQVVVFARSLVIIGAHPWSPPIRRPPTSIEEILRTFRSHIFTSDEVLPSQGVISRESLKRNCVSGPPQK